VSRTGIGANKRMRTPTTAEQHGQEDQDPGLLYLVGAGTAIGAVLLMVIGPPRLPTGAPHLPTETELDLLLPTPTVAQLDGLLLGLGWLVWLLWALCAWVAFTALLRAAVP
jgi:hypothetical protein